jgi:hypothetical protein
MSPAPPPEAMPRVRWWNMAWVTPQYPRYQVDKAGNTLLDIGCSGEELARALDVIDNWRSSHGYPLQCLKMTLINRAEKLRYPVIVAQRLKRLLSIQEKLMANKNMKLSKMHDIGGCRAVVRTVADVERLVLLYEKSAAKNPAKRAEFVKKYDYITQPKVDGYRSVHLVYKYRTASAKHAAFNGLRIEIQIRSRLQHAWATAVETVSTFTGRSIRSTVGDANWKRFFTLMGSAIALKERRPLVPETPMNPAELVAEISALSSQLQIEKVLRQWGAAVQLLTEHPPEADAYLLVLDTENMTMRISAYQQNQRLAATQEYSRVEKEITGGSKSQAVLVSVSSVRDLRRAYPNYFLDTSVFINAVNQAIR